MYVSSLVLWGACRSDPPPPVEGDCTSDSTVAGATQYGIRIRQEGCGELTLADYTVAGEGALRVDLFADGDRILPRITSDADGAVFRGLHMHGPFALGGSGALRSWSQGYGTSSSESGVEDTPALALDDDGLPEFGGDRSGARAPGTSWWAGSVSTGEATLLVGVHAARASSFAVGFDADGTAYAVWGTRGEEIALDEGEILYLDPLFVALGPDPAALWDRWADAVETGTGLTLAPDPAVGWVAHDEAELHDNLLALAAADIGRVRIAAGWQRANGDWQAGDAFPSGLSAAAAAIRDAGATPSLWIAPFRVSPDAEVHTEHPDWFVRERGGGALRVDGDAVLDATHPDAAAWLRDTLSGLVAQGWTSFALDGLDAGAVEGLRVEDVTGTAAYARGLAIVREAGATSLLAIDGPWVPSVGQVDVLRIPDARGAAARGFVTGRWARSDPAPIPVDAGTGPLVGALVTGGAWTVEGALADLGDAFLDPELREFPGEGGAPDDPLGEGVPVQWRFADGRIALLNLGSAPVTVDGPGGRELLGGERAEPGPRTLDPGTGELWR